MPIFTAWSIKLSLTKYFLIVDTSKHAEQLKGILAEYFKYLKYKDAVAKIRDLRRMGTISDDQWKNIKSLILNEEFSEGEALNLIAFDANLPLDEDSDQESYKWLKLFVKNVESENEIIEYLD